MMTKILFQIHLLVYGVQANYYDFRICRNVDASVDIAARNYGTDDYSNIHEIGNAYVDKFA